MKSDRSDSVGEFIATCCTLDPAAAVSEPDLYDRYRAWCQERRGRPDRKLNFCAEILQHPAGIRRTWQGRIPIYSGLGLPAEPRQRRRNGGKSLCPTP